MDEVKVSRLQAKYNSLVERKQRLEADTVRIKQKQLAVKEREQQLAADEIRVANELKQVAELIADYEQRIELAS